MPGSSVFRQLLSTLFHEEHHHQPCSFTASTTVVAGNCYSLQLTSRSYHTILLFIVPILLNLLDLMFENGAASPFATHPKTMRFALGCLLAYCIFFYGAELSFKFSSSTLYAPAFGLGMMLFGSLSVASLSSIFFQDSLQWVVYMLYTLLWTGKLLCSLSPMLYKLYGQVEALVRPTWDKCRGISVFLVPSFQRLRFRHRGNVLPL